VFTRDHYRWIQISSLFAKNTHILFIFKTQTKGSDQIYIMMRIHQPNKFVIDDDNNKKIINFNLKINLFLMTKLPLTLLLLGFLATTLALNPNLAKKQFFVSPDNHLSQEMFQTKNGIIAHSTEREDTPYHNYISQYLLIDIQSREARPILADIVRTCEVEDAALQHLHYYVRTDSLVYYCPYNASLLFIDQSSYTVKTSIPFNLAGSYPQAQLSTDGENVNNVVILCLSTLFNDSPLYSILVKVDMQTQRIAAQMMLKTNEQTVAFASNSYGSCIVTSHNDPIAGSPTKTSIYRIIFSGNSYQLYILYHSLAYKPDHKVITKLFIVGTYIATNINQNLYLIPLSGADIQQVPISIKPINDDIFQPLITSKNGNELYIISNVSSVVRYSFVAPSTLKKEEIGPYRDIQVAYGNLTSQDLMFAIDSNQTYFNILDLKTLKPIYTSLAGFTDLILTNATYSFVQTKNETSIYIFNVSNDTLIAKVPINKNYYYTKEQGILSFFNQADSTKCNLQHVNLINGSTWSTQQLENKFCTNYSISDLTLNRIGSPRYVASNSQDFEINIYGSGFSHFNAPAQTPSDILAINQRLGLESFYFYDANPSVNNINVRFYAWDNFDSQFYYIMENQFPNVSATNGFFFVNQTTTLALSNDTLTVLSYSELTNRAIILETHPNLAHWNSATHFKDSHGVNYAILAQDGLNPALWTSGGFIPLPGSRNETMKANSGGSQSYWIVDAPSPSVGLVRLYDASGLSTQRTFISI